MVDGWLGSVNAGGSAVHIIIQNVTTYFVLYRYVIRDAAASAPGARPLNKDKTMKEQSKHGRAHVIRIHPIHQNIQI